MVTKYFCKKSSQSLTGDLGDFTGVEGQSGKIMYQGGKPDTAKFLLV